MTIHTLTAYPSVLPREDVTYILHQDLILQFIYPFDLLLKKTHNIPSKPTREIALH